MAMMSLLEHPSCKLGFQCPFIPGERIPVLSAARADAENPSGLDKASFSICSCPWACQGLETNLGSHKLIFWFCEQLFAERLRKFLISGQHWALLTVKSHLQEREEFCTSEHSDYLQWEIRSEACVGCACIYPCGRYESSEFDFISFPLGKGQSNKVI